jgi:Mg2+/citrate symporter
MDPLLILQSVVVYATFGVGLYLIAKGKASAIVVFFILPVLWALVAGVPIEGIPDIFQKGWTMIVSVVLTFLVAGWMARVFMQTGITETIVRKAVELGGGSPMLTSISVGAAVFICFLSMFGASGAIPLGVIAIPALLGMGIPPVLTSLIFLMPSVAGMAINPAAQLFSATIMVGEDNVGAVYGDTFPVTAIMAAIGFISFVIFVVYNLKIRKNLSATDGGAPLMMRDGGNKEKVEYKKAPWYSLIAVVIPVVLVFLKVPIIPAFMAALVYGLITAHPPSIRETMDVFHSSLSEGFKDSAYIVAIQFAVGMIAYLGLQEPIFGNLLKSTLGTIVPIDALGIVILFMMLPLVIYRGPLTWFGMGALTISAIMGVMTITPLFLWLVTWPSTIFQGVMDPTNSGVCWSLGFSKTSEKEYLKKGLVWLWVTWALAVFVAYIMWPILGNVY